MTVRVELGASGAIVWADAAEDAAEGEEHAEEGHHGQSAEHSYIPATDELVFGGIASVLVFAALAKFAIPALKKGLAARSERVAKEIEGAAAGKAEAEQAAARVKADLADTGAERDRILAEARAQAASLRQDLLARIDTEVAELRARATADIEAQSGRARSEIEERVVGLAIGAAETVAVRSLDAQSQAALVEDFIAKVGA